MAGAGAAAKKKKIALAALKKKSHAPHSGDAKKTKKLRAQRIARKKKVTQSVTASLQATVGRGSVSSH